MTVRFIREPECKSITGLSRTTRWRLEKAGKFPTRRRMSKNTIGRLSTEIEEWVLSQRGAVTEDVCLTQELIEEGWETLKNMHVDRFAMARGIG